MEETITMVNCYYTTGVSFLLPFFSLALRTSKEARQKPAFSLFPSHTLIYLFFHSILFKNDGRGGKEKNNGYLNENI